MPIIKDKDAGDKEYVITIEDKEGIRVRQESLPSNLVLRSLESYFSHI